MEWLKLLPAALYSDTTVWKLQVPPVAQELCEDQQRKGKETRERRRKRKKGGGEGGWVEDALQLPGDGVGDRIVLTRGR